MWRYDAGRTAVTPQVLSDDLKPIWIRELRKPVPAWPPNQLKLRFDESYEPIVIGGTLFVPSMTSDCLIAFDTDNGQENWRFYTEGPIRFAPVGHLDSVIFASDDGYLYAVHSRTGQLQWKFRGGPAERRILGNNRLVSTWPVRGAPVLYDGIVYFGAGIWSSMGIFIHAVDAGTGTVIWSNTGTGSTYTEQPHNSSAFAGISPQGYFTATEEVLLVSGGRSVPAGFDRLTGEMKYFHFSDKAYGKKAGGYGVSASGVHFFNGNSVYGLNNGKGILNTDPGVYTEDIIYSIFQKKFTARALPPVEIEEIDRKGKTTKKNVLTEIWKKNLPYRLKTLHFKAGDRFYASSEMGLVVGLDTSPEVDVAIAWKSRVKGTPFSMIAADGKLFVVTVEGYIYAFGDSSVSKPVVYSLKNIPLSSTKVTDSVDSTLDLAEWVLQFQSNEGNPGSSFCILIGIGDGRLIDQLMDQTDYRVLVLDGNPELIQGLHRRMDDRGLYGNRIALLNGDPSTFQFPPYLAELMLIQDPLLADETLNSSDLEKLFNALRPYGGTALVIGLQEGGGIPEVIATAADKLSLKTETSPQGLLIRRMGALPGAADWTHQHADSANTVVSQDRLVRAPLDVLWFGGPSNETVLPRHGHGPTPQISEGRLLIEGPDMIRSVDVYTGRLLWERKVPGLGKFYNNTSHQPGANEIGSNYVSVADGIYVVTPNHCLRLDPKTGDILNVFRLPAEDGKPRPKWGHVSVQGDYLIATASPITVSDKEIIAMHHPERNLGPLFTPAGNWKYLAGIHPRKDWIEVGFDDSQWSVGTAGFGMGNNDDQTVLKDMKENYSVVYIRQEFELEDLDEVTELQLAINYDDGFIAYLNGKEVLRVGVESGEGMEPSKITGHKAENYEYFTIALPASALQSGMNVLAVEGHNSDIDNSDFTLDPYLGIPLKGEDLIYNPQGLDLSMLTLRKVPGVDPKADYSAGSGSILVMDRRSGRILWTRNAEYNFRHNALAVSGNRIFCIDKMTEVKESYLKRRGFSTDQKPVLYCLDLQTGEVQWEHSENVFGTWLSYSIENDILLQAGSFSRDRAKDEVGKGLTAYRGNDGSVLWKTQESYDGPLLLHHRTIISQGAAYDLLTGKRKTRLHPLTQQPVNWGFTRNYGCNTAVASEYLLTFRSAAAGYYDLTNNGGTANLGGFRAGCTSSLIAAGGVLNAPDYTKTCNCSYQNQASLAFIHSPGSHGVWTFNQLEKVDGRIRRMGLNFGAPGDRMSSDSVLWMEYPMKGGPAPVIELIVKPFVDEQVTIVKTFDGNEFRIHPSGMVSGQWDWIASSWVEKIEEVQITLSGSLDEIVSYTVNLVFAELKDAQKGDRVFDVYIQGTLVEEAFDVFHQANGKNREIVKTYSGISVHEKLTVRFVPQDGCQWAPVINGMKVVEEIQFIGGGG